MATTSNVTGPTLTDGIISIVPVYTVDNITNELTAISASATTTSGTISTFDISGTNISHVTETSTIDLYTNVIVNGDIVTIGIADPPANLGISVGTPVSISGAVTSHGNINNLYDINENITINTLIGGVSGGDQNYITVSQVGNTYDVTIPTEDPAVLSLIVGSPITISNSVLENVGSATIDIINGTWIVVSSTNSSITFNMNDSPSTTEAAYFSTAGIVQKLCDDFGNLIIHTLAGHTNNITIENNDVTILTDNPAALGIAQSTSITILNCNITNGSDTVEVHGTWIVKGVSSNSITVMITPPPDLTGTLYVSKVGEIKKSIQILVGSISENNVTQENDGSVLINTTTIDTTMLLVGDSINISGSSFGGSQNTADAFNGTWIVKNVTSTSIAIDSTIPITQSPWFTNGGTFEHIRANPPTWIITNIVDSNISFQMERYHIPTNDDVVYGGDITHESGLIYNANVTPGGSPYVVTFTSTTSNSHSYEPSTKVATYDLKADFVLVDTSSYATLVIFPNPLTNPILLNKKAIFVKDKTWNALTHNISIQSSGGGRIEDKTRITLDQNNSCLTFFTDSNEYYISSIYPSNNCSLMPTLDSTNSFNIPYLKAQAYADRINVFNTDNTPAFNEDGTISLNPSSTQRQTNQNIVLLPPPTSDPSMCMVVYGGGLTGKRHKYPLAFYAGTSNPPIDGETSPYNLTNSPYIATGNTKLQVLSTTHPNIVSLSSISGIIPLMPIIFNTSINGIKESIEYYVSASYSETLDGNNVTLSLTYDGLTPVPTIATGSTIVAASAIYNVKYGGELISIYDSNLYPGRIKFIPTGTSGWHIGMIIYFGVFVTEGIESLKEYYISEIISIDDTEGIIVLSDGLEGDLPVFWVSPDDRIELDVSGLFTPNTINFVSKPYGEIPITVTGSISGNIEISSITKNTDPENSAIIVSTVVQLLYPAEYANISNGQIISFIGTTNFNNTSYLVSNINGDTGTFEIVKIDGANPTGNTETYSSGHYAHTSAAIIVDEISALYIFSGEKIVFSNPYNGFLASDTPNYNVTSAYVPGQTVVPLAIFTDTTTTSIPGIITRASLTAIVLDGDSTKSTGALFISDGLRWYTGGWYDPTNWTWDKIIPSDAPEYYTIPDPPSQFVLRISPNVNSFINLPKKLDFPASTYWSYYNGTPNPKRLMPYFMIAKHTAVTRSRIGFSTYVQGGSNTFNDNATVRIYWVGSKVATRPCIWFVSEVRQGETHIRYYPIMGYSP